MDEKEKELLDTQEPAEAEESVEETAEEMVEETVEETEEAAEEVEEKFTEEELIEEEDSSEAVKYVDVELLAREVKSLKRKNRLLSVILAVIVLTFAAVSGFKFYQNYNPYNHMGYPNISGMTVGDMAKMYGMTMEDIKNEYQLPDDVKESTYMDVIQYLAPTGLIVEGQFGMDFETAKETLQFADSVTPETPWGEAEDTIPLSVYIGTGDVLKGFLEDYNLPEDITEDDLWGEIRRDVLKVEYEKANAPQEEIEQPEIPQLEEGEISQEELEEIMKQIEEAQ